MSTIQSIVAREVLDSRGNPTVEVEVRASDGSWGRAIAPSGASTGTHEAVELRDNDPGRYRGKGVLRAVENVRGPIADALVGMSLLDQRAIDERLISVDGTDNFSRLGANAALATSLAAAHARAMAQRVPLYQSLATDAVSLPLPMINMISGGLHAGEQIEFQDFLILPMGAKTYRQALEWTVDVYRSLGEVLAAIGQESVLVGDEGGYGPKLSQNREALDLLVQAIERAGRTPGQDVAIGIDVASTHFYRDGRYWIRLDSDTAVDLTSDDMIDLLAQWVDAYPLVSIEDGLAEDDWQAWRRLTDTLGDRVQLIGDDLMVTNPVRLQKAIDAGAANAILIKPNQIGTLTQTLDVLSQAKQAGLQTVVSARSGETEDSSICDIAVASAAGQIKIGSVARGERLAKYNQLLRLEEHLGHDAPFAAAQFVQRFGR